MFEVFHQIYMILRQTYMQDTYSFGTTPVSQEFGVDVALFGVGVALFGVKWHYLVSRGIIWFPAHIFGVRPHRFAYPPRNFGGAVILFGAWSEAFKPGEGINIHVCVSLVNVGLNKEL